jgi:hypothetical protein
MTSPRIIALTAIADARGHLGVVEAAQDLDFPIARVFYIYNTPAATHRGGHAHKALHQCLISLGAPITLRVHNGQREQSFSLQSHSQALYVPPRHWIDIDHIPQGCTLLVLCSAPYDEADYLRDFNTFLAYCAA